MIARLQNYLKGRREQKAIALLCATNPVKARNGSKAERTQLAGAIRTLNRSHQWMVRNWYEAGNPYSDGTRSNVGTWSADARYDQNPVARRTMEIRCRYWEQNSGLMKKGLDVSSQYVIGTHMPVVTSLASSGDSGWADRAEDVFHEMCESAGLSGESMFSILDVAYRRKKVDGNVLLVETSKPGQVVIRRGSKYETQLDVYRPCFQLIESHRIGSPSQPWSYDPDNSSFDGVQFRDVETKLPNGQVRKQQVRVGYWVNDTSSLHSPERNYAFIPTEFCYYAASAHRVNEIRGVSDFYAAEQTLALLEDLLKLEMRAQEVQSDIATFITNGAGQIVDSKMQNTLGAMGIKVTQGNDGPVVTATDVQKVQEIYQRVWGGKVMVGRTGDTFQHQAPVRPADATLNLWNYLINTFCSAMNWPRLLIFPTFNKGQGTEVRAEIEAANSAWRKEFHLVWKPFIVRAWKYFIGWAINNDERLKNPPADWDKIDVSPPRSVVVDLGYVSANSLEEMAAGVYSLHNWAQDHGTTRQKIIKHAVRDVFDLKLACKKMAELPEYEGLTVDIAEVRNRLGTVKSQLGTAAQAFSTANEPTEPAEVIAK